MTDNKGIRVKKDKRKNRRDLQAPFGKNFVKYLAEIITNSDDSYKRLEEKGLADKESVKEMYHLALSFLSLAGY